MTSLRVLADPAPLADLAIETEGAGWDGLFLWDDVAAEHGPQEADPVAALTALAVRTSRVRLGPMVTPLARQRMSLLCIRRLIRLGPRRNV